MVAFRTVLDSPQQTEWRVSSQIIIKLYVVKVLNSDPSEYSTSLLDVTCTATYELPN